ncbi:MAG: O-antigen ligase family protein [Acidobacteria bacterium]|nr:O-antigen ligase family protein [Acidobacteriota bacterium]
MKSLLAALLFLSILLAWAPWRWAVSLLETGAFLLAAAALTRRSLRFSRLLIPLAAAPLWGLLQLAARTTVYPHATWNAVLLWLTNLAVFFVALQSFDRRAVLWFGFALSVVSTLQAFTSPGKVFWIFPAGHPSYRLSSFLSPNQYAAFVVLVLPLALDRAFEDRRRRLSGVVLAGALCASLIASASRAGFLLGSLEVAFFTLLYVRRRARTLALVAACAALCTLVVGGDLLWTRLLQPDPHTGRREMLASSIEMIRARPALGFGLGAWPVAYPVFARYDDGLLANHAHNDWAEWAAEGGLPFLALLLWIPAASLRPALGSRWGIGVLAVFAHCLVDYPLQQPALAALVFTLLAVLHSEYKGFTKRA